MVQNPFKEINDRFDEIESLINQIIAKSESKSEPDPEERLTRRDIQRQFKISLSTVHKLMKDGVLSYYKVGRKTLFKRKDVENCFK